MNNRLKSFFAFIAVAITFTNCTKNDDTSPDQTPEKPIVENLIKSIEITEQNQGAVTKNKVDFSYDSKNRVTEIKNLNNENLKYEYTATSLVVSATNKVTGAINKHTFTLNPKTNSAQSLQTEQQGFQNNPLDNNVFEYTEKNQLESIIFNSNNTVIDRETILWSDDDIYPIAILNNYGQEVVTFKPSLFLNNASFDLNTLICTYPNHTNPRYAIYSNNLGEKAKYLIMNDYTGIATYKYDFSTNAKGLIEKINIEKTKLSDKTQKTTTTYTISYN
ncbi:MAG: hypothetical protein LBE34_02005 [Flavobacteriaceae bacterium]|jgi:hypothetical protein|nr:hypothetical protein [Flavobacteriaceae bacterium]